MTRLKLMLCGTALAAMLALSSFFMANHRPNTAWDQQAYIWQRVWTKEHADALLQSRNLFSALRVLALQHHSQTGWANLSIDYDELKKDGRPLWLVVRLDEQLNPADRPAIYQHIFALTQSWQARGLNLLGVEIDHDAASARLPEYLQFLQGLKQGLPPALQLSITALPTWSSSPIFPKILQLTDQSVLQVHAVLSPEQGLFDAKLALGWIKRYSQLSDRPFRAALPAYGMGLTRVGSKDWQVESESPLRMANNKQELTVAPQQLAQFIQQLQTQRLPSLQGLIWFRLPLASDQRAWSLSTLSAVILQQPLTPNWQVKIHSLPAKLNETKQLHDIVLHNAGPADAPLPRQISIVASDCLAADAIGNYQLASDRSQQHFKLIKPDQLRSGQSRPIGWLRCTSLQEDKTLVSP
jgi:hypothetical protein